ncbi:MAG: PAS domain S-box protein [Candidatus Zixiibacteriota bacterium]
MGETDHKAEIQKLKQRIHELESTVSNLIDSKEALEAITSTAEDIIFVKGRDFRYTYVNPAMERTLGIPVSEIIGKTPEEIFGEEEARIIASVDRPVLEGQTVNEKKMLNIDGVKRTFHIVQTPIFDLTGGIKAICGIIRDVTLLQKAEEKLRFLGIITEQVTDSIITTDTDFKITYVNKAFRDLFGYSTEEVLGRSPDFLNVDPKSSEIQAEIYKTVSAGKPYRGEALNLKSDGSTFPCEFIIFPLVDAKGDIFAYVGNQRDITKRKQVERELKESKLKLLKAQNVARMGFLDWNLKTNEIELSDEIIDIYGIDLETRWIAPEIVTSFIHLDDIEYVQKNLEMAIKGQKRLNIDHRIVRPDGEVLWIQAQADLIYDEDGTAETLLGTAVDITERKMAADALKESEEKLRAYNEELRVEKQALYQKNIALKEVLEQIEAGKEQLASQIKSNVERVIMPIINGLSNKQPGDMSGYINLLRSNLLDITSPFIGHLESEFSKLPSRQIEICNMVKSGMSCKEIASSLNISVQTVLKQRTLIRKKLGISNKKINLASYLQSIGKANT